MEKTDNVKDISLKVLESYTRDVGRGVARIDYDSMDKLDLSTGSIIKIIGKKTTVAKALPLYPSDEGKEILRTDGLIRRNAEIQIGNSVKIEKVESVTCLSLIVKPLEAIPPIDDRYVSDALEGIPVMIGQKVMIPYFGGKIELIVVKTIPEGITIITQKTESKIIDRKEQEKMEFEEPFELYREKLVNGMKTALKEKNLEQINDIIMKIQKVDFLTQSIKNIINDKSNKVTMSYDDSLLPILQEVFSKKPNDEGVKQE